MSKKVKIVANYIAREDEINLWGVPFTNEDDQYVAEVEADLAEEMIENGRCVPFKASEKKETNTVDFASSEAGELNARLVADKVLTKAEFKKIEGTGDKGAITVGDINDYVASKTPAAPKAPPAPAKVKK